jgi:hypothetical protein
MEDILRGIFRGTWSSSYSARGCQSVLIWELFLNFMDSRNVAAETVCWIYVLNMLVIACCGNNTKTTQTISYHSQNKRLAQSLVSSGPDCSMWPACLDCTVNNETSTMTH